jgi:DNA-binding response OmpR family regulator
MLDEWLPRVFVAEDDEAIRELITLRLKFAGFNVLSAADGAAALEGILQCKPAAVVLDVGLPKMDGFDVLAAIRADPRARRIPVLMLTASGVEDHVRKAVALGAQGYLTKPFNDKELVARVERLIRPESRDAARVAG